MIDAQLRSPDWINELNQLAREGAELIRTKGWVQDHMVGENGELCIISAGHEAVKTAKVTPGLSHVLREVLDQLGHAEEWNDRNGQDQRRVVTYLKRVSVTPRVMEKTFGPRWEQACYLAKMFASWDYEETSAWTEGRDQMEDYATLRYFDSTEPFLDRRESHARNAVCAAASKRAQELGLLPKGPSVGLLTAKIIRPTLKS